MKFDTSTIEGYAEMSAEDKVKAFEGFEFPDPQDDVVKENGKLKNALTKSNSEAAEYKRKLNERLSAEEKAESERQEAIKSMEAELNALRKEKVIAEYSAMISDVGMTGDFAKSTAQAMADLDMETVAKNVKTFLAEKQKQMEADALKAQPGLSTGNAPSSKDIEDAENAKLRKAFGL